MLGELKLKNFLALVKVSSDAELMWMNGYLSGLVSRSDTTAPAPATPALTHPGKITIVYGTETGNSKKLATSFATKAKKIGINARVVGMDQYKVADLPKEEYFFSIVSTHGEGDPPAAAKKFYDHIHQNGFKLEKLKYGVLALGDTSYPLFCQTGEDVDQQLSRLGAQRIVPLQKCDIDYDEDAGEWFDLAFKAVSLNGSAPQVTEAPPAVKKSSGRKIFHEQVLTSVNLNDKGSNKITQHIELSADGIDYLPGDSIGVIPENPSDVVAEILSRLSVDSDHQVKYKNETVSLSWLLKKKLNIFYLPERVVTRFGNTVGTQMADSRADLLDLLKRHPPDGNARVEELVELLEPIAPRLYSIASSPEAHSGEIHITVAKNNYTIDDELKYGLTSDFLCQLAPDDELSFYIHPNSLFRLPEPDRDIIMIGPGTGIAPFRSFIAHRDATGATGKNWLFFGEQHFLSDFLYQTEIQNWLETGVLTKASVAFSRDQQEKIYVQHKMLKEAAGLFQWLESGAMVYVCGTKDPMSDDVENALVSIISAEGNRNREEALQYIEQMKEDGRYMKDVY
ncbi:MAG: flavodoxin domain-containing protein [Chitinophagaceae bacterium]